MTIKIRSLLIGLYLAAMFIYTGTHAYFIFAHWHSESDPGWYVEEDRRIRLREMWAGSGEGPLPLHEVDEVITLNGQRFTHDLDRARIFENLPPGSAYSLTIKRDGTLIDHTLRSAPPSSLATAFSLSYRVIFPGIFLITALVVFLLRPDDKQAVLLTLLLGGTWASDPAFYVVLANLPGWLILILAAAFIGGNLIPAIFLHLFLVFPERSRLLKRWPWLEYLSYVVFVAGALPTTLFSVYLWVNSSSPERALTVDEAYPLLDFGNGLFTLIYLSAGLAVLLSTYRRSSRLSRRKLRVVVSGTIVGVLPLIAAFIVMIVFHPPTTKGWALTVMAAFSALLFIPLSFAYAIIRHQVIPVRLIIRRSVQYLLAKQALRVVLALPFLGLAWSAFSNRHRTLVEIVFNNSIYFYLTVIVAATLSLKFRRPLSDWIDRQFFREAYDQERMLRELIDEVKQLDSMTEISRRVTEKIEQALHPDQIHLFYRGEGTRDLTLNHSSGAQSPELKISEEFHLLSLMETLGRAQDFPFAQKNDLPQQERNWLVRVGARLIVPMTGTDGRLAGLLLLGQKKAETPYTARDRNLLESLADQVALLYENLHLKGRVEKDRRMRREVLARLETQNISIIKECPVCGNCYDDEQNSCPKDGAELTLPLPIERILARRYRLDRAVGRGGMGAVYEAMDLRLGRTIAVKVLGGQRFGDAVSLRRFEREAQMAARLTHPNIVRIYDYGLLHDTDGAYLVMELLEGETLGSAIKSAGPIPPTTAAEWLDQALDGIKAAHELRVLHRDLKPDNIFLARTEGSLLPLVKILDFGLAKFTRPEMSGPSSITTDGVTVGTFGYMSPEQLIGNELDERSDIFSIGVILAETLTGSNPFAGQSFGASLTTLLHNSFHLAGNSPEVLALDRVLQKCLAKDPAERYASVDELKRDLIPALRSCQNVFLTGDVRGEQMKKSSTQQEAQTQITGPPPR